MHDSLCLLFIEPFEERFRSYLRGHGLLVGGGGSARSRGNRALGHAQVLVLVPDRRDVSGDRGCESCGVVGPGLSGLGLARIIGGRVPQGQVPIGGVPQGQVPIGGVPQRDVDRSEVGKCTEIGHGPTSLRQGSIVWGARPLPLGYATPRRHSAPHKRPKPQPPQNAHPPQSSTPRRDAQPPRSFTAQHTVR